MNIVYYRFIQLWVGTFCLLAFACALSAAPCLAQNGKVKVVTTNQLLAELVIGVCGEECAVTILLPANIDTHHFELSPSKVSALFRAELVFYNNKNSDAWLLEQSSSSSRASLVALGEVSSIKGLQNHFWLNPVEFGLAADRVFTSLLHINPKLREVLQSKLTALKSQFAESDRYIRSLSKTWQEYSYISFHPAWLNFSEAYGLKPVGFLKLSEHSEPSPKSFAALVNLARAKKVSAIWVDENTKPVLAQRFAKEARLKVLYLPVMPKPRETYFDFIRRLADTIAKES